MIGLTVGLGTSYPNSWSASKPHSTASRISRLAISSAATFPTSTDPRRARDIPTRVRSTVCTSGWRRDDNPTSCAPASALWVTSPRGPSRHARVVGRFPLLSYVRDRNDRNRRPNFTNAKPKIYRTPKSLGINIIYVVVGLVGLTAGAAFLIDGATGIARGSAY